MTESLPTAEIDATPTPVLTYYGWSSRGWDPDPSDVARELGSPRLYSVHRAQAWLWDGGLRVTLEGPMRKRDGGRGQHNRSLVVDLSRQQPEWLTNLIRDARARLGTPEWAESRYVYPPGSGNAS